MNHPIDDHDQLLSQLRRLLARKFRLSEREFAGYTHDEPLIGGRLGLDSLDALELGICVEEEFGISINSAAESQLAFASIASLAGFIRRQASPLPVAAPPRQPSPFRALS